MFRHKEIPSQNVHCHGTYAFGKTQLLDQGGGARIGIERESLDGIVGRTEVEFVDEAGAGMDNSKVERTRLAQRRKARESACGAAGENSEIAIAVACAPSEQKRAGQKDRLKLVPGRDSKRRAGYGSEVPIGDRKSINATATGEAAKIAGVDIGCVGNCYAREALGDAFHGLRRARAGVHGKGRESSVVGAV